MVLITIEEIKAQISQWRDADTKFIHENTYCEYPAHAIGYSFITLLARNQFDDKPLVFNIQTPSITHIGLTYNRMINVYPTYNKGRLYIFPRVYVVILE